MEKEAEENYTEYSLEQHLDDSMEMADYVMTHHRHLPPDSLSFADVMNMAGLNQSRVSGEGNGGFPESAAAAAAAEQRSENSGAKSKRKRARSLKTSEEVEMQRMTHIAVERNRRKQMNEHLRVLRALMPSSYVQRADQASIIGGAIEFVRELEQLLQCLESQKRRRAAAAAGGDPNKPPSEPQPNLPPFISAADQIKNVDYEEAAESKSCLADVEVKLLGADAMIKILCRRRPGQLLRIIAAMEELQFSILHLNITTIEHTVLYSFNVKITSEVGYRAEDIASSIQQIFSFINAGAL